MLSNKEKHYMLWDEIRKTGGKSKIEAFIKLFPGETSAHNFCFACKEAAERIEEKNIDISEYVPICNFCPITDPRAIGCCDCLYDDWEEATTKKERSKLAKEIRDLPWLEVEQWML